MSDSAPAPRTVGPEGLTPATRPTFYFIGVTTGSSSIRRVFPKWADELGLGDVEMVGIDLPLHADPEAYRRVVTFLRDDPHSLGALVTTHKIDLYRAAADLFDEVDPLATLMGEVSCIAKRDGRFTASAKDPISSGHAIDAFLPEGHFARTGADLILFGAGGSAIAIDWYLSRPERADRPRRVVVTNRSSPRLDDLSRIHRDGGSVTPLDTVVASSARHNDAVLEQAAPGSVIVNATGLGKDAPGSPLTDAAAFPAGAIVWDLNYRGELDFLRQAEARRQQRGLGVEDGWVYFIHGWTQVISEVFGVEIPPRGDVIDRLSEIAREQR